MDDAEIEMKLRGTFARLDGWTLWGAMAFGLEQGSELEIDDQDWPPIPVSEIAHRGLQVAADHLLAASAHIEARQLFAFSHLTYADRPSLVAAQAVWVLAPDDRRERLKWSRAVAAYAHKKHLQYLRGLQDIAPQPHQNAEDGGQAGIATTTRVTTGTG